MTESRSINELLDALKNTPHGDEVLNPEESRQRIFREMADDEDPLLREIGQQLRDGSIRPHQLLKIPGYDVVVEERLDALRSADVEEIRSELTYYLASLVRENEVER